MHDVSHDDLVEGDFRAAYARALYAAGGLDALGQRSRGVCASGLLHEAQDDGHERHRRNEQGRGGVLGSRCRKDYVGGEGYGAECQQDEHEGVAAGLQQSQRCGGALGLGHLVSTVLGARGLDFLWRKAVSPGVQLLVYAFCIERRHVGEPGLLHDSRGIGATGGVLGLLDHDEPPSTCRAVRPCGMTR